ncbi:MAG: HalOD1 output domain-containing protein [Haloarculaceae archaeon]
MSSQRIGEADSLTTAVVEEVARAKGVDVLDLDPLYESVDLDTLDDLFASGFDGRVEFTYEDYVVSVRGRQQIAVDRTEPSSSSNR